MEPDTIKLHCSNCKPSGWRQFPREKVVVMLDLESCLWVFEAKCHVCSLDIVNTRRALP